MVKEPLWFSAAGAAACAAGFAAAGAVGFAGAAGLACWAPTGFAGAAGFAASRSRRLGSREHLAWGQPEPPQAHSVRLCWPVQWETGAACSFSALGSGFRFRRLFARRGSRSRRRRTRCRCLGRAVQRKLNHVLDDGNFLIQQANHQFKVNTADAPLIHYARRALGIDLDVFKLHEAAGVLDRHEATVESINGIFVAAVFLERFQRGMNNFKLLAHRNAERLQYHRFLRQRQKMSA